MALARPAAVGKKNLAGEGERMREKRMEKKNDTKVLSVAATETR